MKRSILPVILVLLFCAGGVALAQTGGGASTGLSTGYDLTWWTADGGGGTASGGGYALHGTAGQPDAGPSLAGGGYTLTGGFWAGRSAGGTPGHKMYFPVVSKRH